MDRDDYRTTPDVIIKAKTGSIPHLKELSQNIPKYLEGHHEAVLDAVLEHLRFPDASSGPLSSSDALSILMRAPLVGPCYHALAEVNQWLIAQPERTHTTIAISLRLSQSSALYINCASYLLRADGRRSMQSRKRHDQLVNSALDTHAYISKFFTTLFATRTRIYAILVKDWSMLEVIVRLWVAFPSGQPPLYADKVVGHEDRTVSLFYRFVRDNSEGMARMVLEGMVCTPKVFVERTILWMECLNNIPALRHLPHLRTYTHETSNTQHIGLATDRLIQCDAELRELFMALRAAERYMKVMSNLSLLLCAESLGERRGQAVEPGVPPIGNAYENDIALKKLLGIEARVVKWVTSTPNDIPAGIKRLISHGAVKILGHCAHLRREDDGVANLMDSTYGVLDEYAVYPKVLPVLNTSVSEDLGPWLGPTEQDPRRSKEFKRTARDLKLSGIALPGAPLQYVQKEKRVALCDNLKHFYRSERTSFDVVKVCASCHSVIYCSPECQKDDWRTFHRHECADMYRVYTDRKAKKSAYSQNTRAFQASLLRYGFDTYTQRVEREGRIPKNSCGRDVVINVDPLRDENTSYKSLGEYLFETTPLIPAHLRRRFDFLVDSFTKTNGTYKGVDASRVRAQSARLVERGFRFGNQDINLLLLLQRGSKEVPQGALVAMNQSYETLNSFETRDVTTPSVFEIHGSLVYMSPQREHVDIFGGL